MHINEAFNVLRTYYGTHYGAAKALGMSREHYTMLKNEKKPLPSRTEEYIKMKAKEALAANTCRGN